MEVIRCRMNLNQVLILLPFLLLNLQYSSIFTWIRSACIEVAIARKRTSFSCLDCIFGDRNKKGAGSECVCVCASAKSNENICTARWSTSNIHIMFDGGWLVLCLDKRKNSSLVWSACPALIDSVYSRNDAQLLPLQIEVMGSTQA